MEIRTPTVPTRQLWAEFLFARVLVFIIIRSNFGDMPTYFEGVSRFVSKGSPYGEDAFGYPVLAFLFVLVPWFFGGKKLELYFPLFRAECFAVDILLFYLLNRRASRQATLFYIVTTTILANLLYHRLDLALGCLLVIALAFESNSSLKSAALTLGASIAFKIIPVMLLPTWLMWTLRRSLKQACIFGFLVALGAGVPTAIAYALWGSDSLLFLGAHAGRGMQLESSWASIAMVLMEFGLSGKSYFDTGSYNLTTSLEGAFQTASNMVVPAAALWGAVLAARLPRGSSLITLVLTSTLGALILASKVFSPQYLLFFLPLLAISLDSLGAAWRHIVVILGISCCALTTWFYPYHEKELIALSRVATVPLVLRNALFFVLVVLLQIHAWRRINEERRDSGRFVGQVVHHTE